MVIILQFYSFNKLSNRSLETGSSQSDAYNDILKVKANINPKIRFIVIII